MPPSKLPLLSIGPHVSCKAGVHAMRYTVMTRELERHEM